MSKKNKVNDVKRKLIKEIIYLKKYFVLMEDLS